VPQLSRTPNATVVAWRVDQAVAARGVRDSHRRAA